MSNLTAANLARLNAALDKQYRFSFGVFTFRQAIEAGRFSRAEVGKKPSAQWDRRKFNRMDARQQAEYQRKLDTMKPAYRLLYAGCPHGLWVECPKIVLEHFESVTA